LIDDLLTLLGATPNMHVLIREITLIEKLWTPVVKPSLDNKHPGLPLIGAARLFIILCEVEGDCQEIIDGKKNQVHTPPTHPT